MVYDRDEAQKLLAAVAPEVNVYVPIEVHFLRALAELDLMAHVPDLKEE